MFDYSLCAYTPEPETEAYDAAHRKIQRFVTRGWVRNSNDPDDCRAELRKALEGHKKLLKFQTFVADLYPADHPDRPHRLKMAQGDLAVAERRLEKAKWLVSQHFKG